MGDSLNINGVMYNSIDEFIGDLDGDSSGGGTSAPKDKNGLTIASGTDTTPFLPDNNSEITNNNLSTGLTVKDSNQNEFN